MLARVRILLDPTELLFWSDKWMNFEPWLALAHDLDWPVLSPAAVLYSAELQWCRSVVCGQRWSLSGHWAASILRWTTIRPAGQLSGHLSTCYRWCPAVSKYLFRTSKTYFILGKIRVLNIFIVPKDVLKCSFVWKTRILKYLLYAVLSCWPCSSTALTICEMRCVLSKINVTWFMQHIISSTNSFCRRPAEVFCLFR